MCVLNVLTLLLRSERIQLNANVKTDIMMMESWFANPVTTIVKLVLLLLFVRAALLWLLEPEI